MNELKPEEVMKELERIASKANCNHMRHLEGCGCFCIRLGKNVDDMAKGRSPECNENCEHFAPPYIEEVCRATLALLREKDAEIERLKAENVALENGLEISLHQQKQIEADTVRKMQERLRKEAYPFPCAIGVEYAVPYCKVDQIAKEMLEGK